MKKLLLFVAVIVTIFIAGNLTGFMTATVIPKENYTSKTFILTEGESICEIDGKPIIRMYSTVRCPHCPWMNKIFDQIAKEYVERNLVEARHWLYTADGTWDNVLTNEVEEEIPSEELEVFYRFDPNGTLPLFVFGCKYYRIGTGNEAINDMVIEEKEIRSVIDKLIEEVRTR